MPNPEGEAPVVPLPASVERRLRLGPFASARDALKFVTYAAAGALLAPFLSPFAWLPVVGVGFAVSVWRPDGEAVDERLVRWIAWTGRRRQRGPVTPIAREGSPDRPFVRLGPGQYAAVLRLSGTPVAYRPPAELDRLFREFGAALRSSDGVLVLRVGTTPLTPERLLPRARAPPTAEGAAQAGYRELVTVLCRRRSARSVDLAMFSSGGGREVAAQLDQRARGLAARLDPLGLRVTRLRGGSLADAARRLGWKGGTRSA